MIDAQSSVSAGQNGIGSARVSRAVSTSDTISGTPMIATGMVALPIYLLREWWQRKPVSQIRQKIKPIKPKSNQI